VQKLVVTEEAPAADTAPLSPQHVPPNLRAWLARYHETALQRGNTAVDPLIYKAAISVSVCLEDDLWMTCLVALLLHRSKRDGMVTTVSPVDIYTQLLPQCEKTLVSSNSAIHLDHTTQHIHPTPQDN
jgi:hypothetical protein